jgi:hypothetical protein
MQRPATGQSSTTIFNVKPESSCTPTSWVRLDNDRPHTVALDPLKHGGEAGAHIDGISAAHGGEDEPNELHVSSPCARRRARAAAWSRPSSFSI